MKFSPFLLLLFGLLTFQACMPSQIELWVNTDESGKVEMTYDLGDMAGMMTEMMESFGFDSLMGEDIAITSPKESSESGAFEQSGNLFEEMPDSVKEKLPYPELMENVQMTMKGDSIQMTGSLKITILYANLEEYKKIIENFGSMEDDPNMMMLGGEGMNDMFVKYKVDLQNGIFKLDALDKETLDNDPDFQELVALKDSFATMDAESKEMIELFFGGSTKTIVHLPGKIKKCTDPTGKIKGNTIEFDDDLIKIAMGEQELHEREIRFKKIKKMK